MTAIVFLVLRILISICLYAFLVVIFVHLWKDIRQQSERISNLKIPSVKLSVRVAEKSIRPLIFDKEEVTIGRDPTCDCQLDDETVSNVHAKLKYHHLQWWLEDNGSTNGTWINNHPVNTPVVVISGDEITCGKHTIEVEIAGERSVIPDAGNQGNGVENG